MSIFQEIKNSLYNPDYYQELIEKPFSHSIKYYCALTLVLGIIVTMVGSALIVPAFNTVVWGVKEVALSVYPDDLKISVEGGLVKTNVQEPFVIAIPEKYRAEAGGKKNLLVIDTSTTTSPEKLKSYETVALLAKDSIIYESGTAGQSGSQSFATSSNFKLDKAGISQFFNAIEPYYKFFTPILVLGLFMLVVLIMVGTMLYLLLVALLVWILAALNKWDISYLKAYQMSLHFATLGFVVALISILVLPGSGALIFFTATLVLLALVTFKVGNDEPRESSKNE